jgi:putative ABC transport system ATP-binding protein/lipoprotein-releasing system ATP-binding protein
MGASSLSNPALVEALDLARVYERGQMRVVALATASCGVRAGNRIAVTGPSGSGKSTLLHLLGGLDEPTSGTIGWPALGPRATLRPAHVAFVFQAPSLLPALSVVENVELPLLLGDVDPTPARAAALDALGRLQLSDLAERLPEELSGGQAQRAALARALASRPQLLLADEPTGQLDHATARQVIDVLLASIEDTPTALVIATHDPAVSRRMALCASSPPPPRTRFWSPTRVTWRSRRRR